MTNPEFGGIQRALTHKGFVNRWECDENDHWNVQYFIRALQYGSEIFAITNGVAGPGGTSAVCRHVRFHRELRDADAYSIYSTLCRLPDGSGAVVHCLHREPDGLLCTTSIDRAPWLASIETRATHEIPADATPRGLPAGPTGTVESKILLENGDALVSHLNVVRPHECDHTNQLTAHAIASRFTDGASHIWTHAGITPGWLAGNECGRVAVEMKITRHGACSAGAGLRLVSWIGDANRSTFLIRHQLEDVYTGAVVAGGEVRCLVMDLASRRARALPDCFNRSRVASAKDAAAS